MAAHNSTRGERQMKGWFGYFVRERVNEFRCWLVGPVDDFLFLIIDWLDKKPSVAYWRKKDRGL